jgi:hypothetical protein
MFSHVSLPSYSDTMHHGFFYSPRQLTNSTSASARRMTNPGASRTRPGAPTEYFVTRTISLSGPSTNARHGVGQRLRSGGMMSPSMVSDDRQTRTRGAVAVKSARARPSPSEDSKVASGPRGAPPNTPNGLRRGPRETLTNY